MISLLQTTEFAQLFSGSKVAYGSYKLTGEIDPETGKKRGIASTKQGLLTDEMYYEHLLGNEGLGVVPIAEGDVVRFCALDVDQYNTDWLHLVKTLYRHSFPLYPFKSKSGGLHLYMFFRDPVPAASAIVVMGQLRDILHLPKTTELFPKQKALGKGAVGNWINLPYFNAENTDRPLLLDDMQEAHFEQAIHILHEARYTLNDIKSFIDNLPLGDGPPCLQTLFLLGDTKFRNNYLFNIARYFKAKQGDLFEEPLLDANAALSNPLPIEELVTSIIQSHRKREYAYKCTDQPICDFCDKKLCATRKFGISGDEISNLSFEQLTKFSCDPPYYVWRVNERDLKFYSEAEIIDQRAFREQVMRRLHILPNRVKEAHWVRIVNQALSSMVVANVLPGDDISPGALFLDHLAEFVVGRAMAVKPDQLLMGRVYLSVDTDEYWFKAKDLLQYIVVTKQFKAFSLTQIQSRLVELGGVAKRVYLNADNRGARIWAIPVKSLEGLVDVRTNIAPADFLEELKGEEY